MGDRELAAGLRKFVDAKYAGILGMARRAWERDLASTRDPSDACVSVKISIVPLTIKKS
ncbi:MAG: hypothetical protein M3032_00980 [Verrucomicrobiota bacterium]|nr:hypothetical protein [Verrucomicrobiota bacterium]